MGAERAVEAEAVEAEAVVEAEEGAAVGAADRDPAEPQGFFHPAPALTDNAPKSHVGHALCLKGEDQVPLAPLCRCH